MLLFVDCKYIGLTFINVFIFLIFSVVDIVYVFSVCSCGDTVIPLLQLNIQSFMLVEYEIEKNK